MPLSKPSDCSNSSPRRVSTSEFAFWGDFNFRRKDVDGFYHNPDLGETIVNYRGYTQLIADPEKKLHDALKELLRSEPLE